MDKNNFQKMKRVEDQDQDPEDLIYIGEVLAVNSTGSGPGQCHSVLDLINLTNSEEEDDDIDLQSEDIENLISLTMSEEDLLNVNIKERDPEDDKNVINLTISNDDDKEDKIVDLDLKEKNPEGGGDDVNVINLTDSDPEDDKDEVELIGDVVFVKSEENYLCSIDLTTEEIEDDDANVVLSKSKSSVKNSGVKESKESENVSIVIEDDTAEEASSKGRDYLNDPLYNFQPSMGCESTPKAKSFAKSKTLMPFSKQFFQAQDLGEGIKSGMDAEESDDELLTNINNYYNKSLGMKECQYGHARYKNMEDMEISNLTASFSDAMTISFNNQPDVVEDTPVNVVEDSSDSKTSSTSTLTPSKLPDQTTDMKSLYKPGDYIQPRVILQKILDYFTNLNKKTEGDSDLEDKSDMDISRIFEMDEPKPEVPVTVSPSDHDQEIERPEPAAESGKIDKVEALLIKLFDDQDMVILDSTGIDDTFVFEDLARKDSPEKKEDPVRKEDPPETTKVNKVPVMESCSKSDQVLKLSKASTTIKKTASVKCQQDELKNKIHSEIVSKPVIKEIKKQPKKPPPPATVKPSEPKKITRNQNLLNDLLKMSEFNKFIPTGKKKLGLRFINLHEDSLEYRHVKMLFNESIFTLRHPLIIQKIEKVINPYLFAQYLLKRESDAQKFGAKLTEHLLFHGTPASKVQSICTNNFDWRLTGLSRGHKFGQGVNFAWNASYASHYVKDQGNCKIIVALVGNDNASEGDSKTKLPLAYCDATANGTGEVLVKYEDNEFYPAYVVHCGRSWAVRSKNYNGDQYYVDSNYRLARQPWLPSANFDYNYAQYRGNSYKMDFISDIY